MSGDLSRFGDWRDEADPGDRLAALEAAGVLDEEFEACLDTPRGAYLRQRTVEDVIAILRGERD